MSLDKHGGSWREKVFFKQKNSEKRLEVPRDFNYNDYKYRFSSRNYNRLRYRCAWRSSTGEKCGAELRCDLSNANVRLSSTKHNHDPLESCE